MEYQTPPTTCENSKPATPRKDIIVIGNDTRLLSLFERLKRPFNEPTITIHRELDGRILGGWVLTGWSEQTVQVHVAGEGRWMNFAIIEALFRQCFDVIGAKVALAAIDGHNTKAMTLGLGLGFSEFGVIDEIDLHLLKMSRAQCRWL